MSNQNKQYICSNLCCENFFCDSNKILINTKEVIPGIESETCCPKCSMPLMDYEVYLEEQKQLENRKRKKMIVIGLSAVFIVGIALVVYFFLIPMVGQKKTVLTEEPRVEINAEPIIENVQKVESAQEDEPMQEGEPVPINVANTKIFNDGSKYVGALKNGKMNGMGTYYYAKRQLISNKDLKKRFAEKGDYFIGEFHDDRVVSGKLYNNDTDLKEVIIIGR
ncbi:MAG TPA: hypothetical protein VFC92_10160 [Bacteroidales bacterium]|nr:hypothetical protein [Bacteroidales bacterium]